MGGGEEHEIQKNKCAFLYIFNDEAKPKEDIFVNPIIMSFNNCWERFISVDTFNALHYFQTGNPPVKSTFNFIYFAWIL